MSILKIIFTGLNDKDVCLVESNNKIRVGNLILVDTNKGRRVAVVSDIINGNSLPISSKIQFVKLVSGTEYKIVKRNETLAREALNVARKYADSLNMSMGFVFSEYTFDRKQLFFSFVADTRIDFRELAKRLAQKYKTRIELRQIGVRDKSSIIGGLGPCGLPLCCNTFLSEFNSVSINMAKNQLLALNPSKINGVCGRLLCCLNYENDYYREMKKLMPNVGEILLFEGENVKVISCDYLNCSYNVERNNGEIVVVDLGDSYGKTI